MTKIIGISGRKQAGKNTVANYINGDILQSQSMVKSFTIDDNGQLVIETVDDTENGGCGIFDITRKDSQFIEYAHRALWPYVKVYHFADYLKEMCVDLFDLNPTNVYGTDAQKNEQTAFLWENMPNAPTGKVGYLSHRDFLEYFGTSIIRKIKYDTWSSYTLKTILKEKSNVAIIPDVRFPNEVQAIKNSGGIVIRLTRDIFNSSTEAESALDKNKYDWANFDIVINNSNLSMSDFCDKLATYKQIWN